MRFAATRGDHDSSIGWDSRRYNECRDRGTAKKFRGYNPESVRKRRRKSIFNTP